MCLASGDHAAHRDHFAALRIVQICRVGDNAVQSSFKAAISQAASQQDSACCQQGSAMSNALARHVSSIHEAAGLRIIEFHGAEKYSVFDHSARDEYPAILQ